MTADEVHSIAQQIFRIVPLVMRTVGAEMRRGGHIQEPSHFGLLKMLFHRRRSLSELAEKHSVSLPTMSKSIRRLEERNWVALKRAEEDRRMVWVELTPTGQAVLDEAEDQTLQRIEGLVVALSAQDQATLSAGLSVLRDMFEAAPQPEIASSPDCEPTTHHQQ